MGSCLSVPLLFSNFWHPIYYIAALCLGVLNCSSKDILMRVVAQNLSPELTLVEKVC